MKKNAETGEFYWKLDDSLVPPTLSGNFDVCYCPSYDTNRDIDSLLCNNFPYEFPTMVFQLVLEDKIAPELTMGLVVAIDHGVQITFQTNEEAFVLCAAQRMFSSPLAEPTPIADIATRDEIMGFLTPGQKDHGNDGYIDVPLDQVGKWQSFIIDKLYGGEPYRVSCWAKDKARAMRTTVAANGEEVRRILHCFMRKLWCLEMVNFIEVLEDIGILVFGMFVCLSMSIWNGSGIS